MGECIALAVRAKLIDNFVVRKEFPHCAIPTAEA
jgi:hypothetical protein